MNTAIGMRIPPWLREQGIETVAAFARGIGLDALDLPELDGQSIAACRSHGLRIGTVDVKGVGQLLSKDERRRSAAADSVLEQIRSAQSLGIHVLFLCLVPEDITQSIADSLSLFREVFPAIAAACEQAEVKLAFEGWPGPAPHYPTLGYTPEVWRAMFDSVPSVALGLCYDPSHLVRLGIDYLRVLDEFSDRIHHCHGKDTDLLPEAQYLFGHFPATITKTAGFSGGSWRYCIPGQGSVNWGKVAFGLGQCGYQGVVSIELEDARYWGALEYEQQGIGKAFEHLSHYLHR